MQLTDIVMAADAEQDGERSAKRAKGLCIGARHVRSR